MSTEPILFCDEYTGFQVVNQDDLIGGEDSFPDDEETLEAEAEVEAVESAPELIESETTKPAEDDYDY